MHSSHFILLISTWLAIAHSASHCPGPLFPSRRLADSSHDDDHKQLTEQPQPIFFLTVALFLGAVTGYVLPRLNTHVPYTVVMFIEGIICGGLFIALEDVAQDTPFENIFDSMQDWTDLNPALLMYIFIPVLTFTDAMELPWVDFKEIFCRCIAQGTIYVIFTLLAITGVMMLLLPSWTTVLCFLFASCLSANDPLSVVPVMRAARAPHGLTILVLGETLFTEGAATVLAHLFASRIMDCESAYSAWNVSSLLIREFVVSPLIGVVTGYMAVQCMGLANRVYQSNDTTNQIVISIICAYFSFYVSEYEFRTSGVVATCAAGVVFASIGKKRVLRPDMMEQVWGTLEWVCSTFIFLIAGLVIVDEAFRSGIKGIDALNILVLFVVLTISRVVAVMTAYPLLSRLHGELYGLSEAQFLSGTAMKGAISTILILEVLEYSRDGYISDNDMKKFLIMGGGVVVLNQLLTARWIFQLLYWCGLLPKPSPEAVIVRRFLNFQITNELTETYDCSGGDTYGYLAISKVISSNYRLAAANEEYVQMTKDIQYLTDMNRPFNREMYRVLRVTYLESVYSVYLHDIDVGRLPRHSYAAQWLINSITTALNSHNSDTIADWDLIKEALEPHPYVLFLYTYVLDPILSCFTTHALSAGLLAVYMKRRMYILTSYINAHKRAQRRIERFISLDSDEEYNIIEVNALISDSERLVCKAESALRLIPEEHMELLFTNQAATAMLHMQAHLILRMKNEGLLSESSAKDELDIVMKNAAEVEAERQLHSRRFIAGFSKKGASSSSLSVERGSEMVSSVVSPSTDRTRQISASEMLSTMRMASLEILLNGEQTESPLHKEKDMLSTKRAESEFRGYSARPSGTLRDMLRTLPEERRSSLVTADMRRSSAIFTADRSVGTLHEALLTNRRSAHIGEPYSIREDV